MLQQMTNKEDNQLTNDILLADALLRIKALENLLVSKGIITTPEFQEEMEKLAKAIAKSVLERAKIPGDLTKIVNDL